MFAQVPDLREVKGVLKDAKGNVLPGVTVVVKGTTRSKISAGDGTFAISVKEGDVLAFSSVGYSPAEVQITRDNFYTVVLTETTTTLGDVVVVGYGRQNRKALTSSISTVKGEDMNRGAISDVGQLLQGKVPGLNISRSGDPNRAAAIILRGASTLREGAQSPLFVIDGVVGADISVIAPDDITSIDVLKDAAATAIYGNRAANGVIMVTTKRPKKGQLQLGYNGYVAMEKVSNQYDMMDATQLKDFLAKNNQSLSPADDLGANTNWQNEVQRSSAISHNHNISLGGGTEQTTYSASLNYFDQQGVVKTSALNRVIARLSIEQKAFDDKLKLGLSVTNSVSDAKMVPYRNTVLAQMLTYLPTAPVKNADGSWYDNFEQTSYYNPVSMLENATERSKYSNLLGTFSAQAKLPFGFTYDINLSYQRYQSEFGAFYNSYFTKNYNNVRNTPDPPANPYFITLVGANGVAVRNAYKNTNKILETFLTWNREFGGHSINAVLGYSWQESINGDGFQASSTNFPSDDVGYSYLGMGNPYAISSFRVNYGDNLYQQIRLISDFMRVNYSYRNKYLLQASVRRDGASVFGENNQWGYFPAVGVAWRIIEEGFMKDQSLFTDLKLRASYGLAGNSLGIGALSAKRIYGQVGTFYYDGSYQTAAGFLQSENPDLKWEKTATTNIGLDFGLLQNRLTGSVDVYQKKTTDLIFTYAVPTNIYPTGSFTANAGEMSNKGIELTLNAEIIRQKRFSWSSGFNLAHNRNKLVKMGDGKTFTTDSVLMVQPDGGGQTGATVQILVQGQPIGQFYTLQYAGKNENGVSQYQRRDGSLTTAPLNRTDYHIVGNAQPKLLLGWTNTFRYGNFDLNLFIRSVIGNKIMNVTRADLFRPNTARLANIPVEVANESVNDINSYRYSTRFLESGSYVRLDNATLGYSIKKIGKYIQQIRPYISVNNLFVITNYKGIDPEINQGGIAPGVDTNNFYPKTRTFLFGVNASF